MDFEWAGGKTLIHNGSNEIWYASVLVTPLVNRIFIVATNSCDFSSTPKLCSDLTNTMIKMELDIKNH